MTCTTGVITHYCRNQEALILLALTQVTERLKVLMKSALKNVSSTERLVVMLSALLPIDVQRQESLQQVWVAFLGYAVGQDSLMAKHQQSASQLRTIIIQELKHLQTHPLIRAEIDPEPASNALLALGTNALLAPSNGVSLDSLIQANKLSVDQQQWIIRRYIKQVLT